MPYPRGMGPGAEPLVVDNGGIVVPKRFFLALGATLYGAVVPIVVVALMTRAYPLLAGVVHALLFGSMSLAYGARSTKGALVREGRLEISSEGISFRGQVVASRGELRQGFTVPTEEGLLLRFDRSFAVNPLFVRVPDRATADAALATLGFDAKHTAARMRIASALLSMPVSQQTATILGPLLLLVPIALLLLAGLGPGAWPLAVAAFAAFILYTFVIAFAPTTVLVGTDGFEHTWLGTRAFVPFANVTAVETYKEWAGSKMQRGVRVTLDGAPPLKLPTGQSDVGDVEAASLAARLTEARRAYVEGGQGGQVASLRRGDQDLRTWIAALRRLGDGAIDHRTSAVPLEALLRTVEDSSAAVESRLGAAVAATSGGDPDAVRRVRVAAAATASPRLRVALETVAVLDPSEAEAEAALREALEREALP